MRHKLFFLGFIFFSVFTFLWAEELEIMSLTYLSIILSVLAILMGVQDRNILSPLKIFFGFTGLYVLIDQIWLINDFEQISSFFRYTFFIDKNYISVLPREMIIISISLYAGTSIHRYFHKKNNHQNYIDYNLTGIEKHWLLIYSLGLFIISWLLYISGDLNNIFENINNRRERAAGRGVLIILSYYSYLGVLLWYRYRIHNNKFSFILLIKLTIFLSPMLILGSRTEFIMVILSSLYMSSMYGYKLPIKRGISLFILIIIFLAAFQGIRSGSNMDEFNFLEGISKDMSMGVGYAIAVNNDFFSDVFELQTLVLTFALFIPSEIKSIFTMPISPNNLFTLSLYSYDVNSTVSIGLFGEARYLLPGYFRILYYLLLGAFFSWTHLSLSKKHIFAASVIAGAAIRFSKGGITAAIPNIFNILILYFIVLFIFTVIKNPIRKKH